MAETLMLECSPQIAALLDALVLSGLFGPSRDTAAQRILELKLYEMAISIGTMNKNGKS